MGAGAFTVGVSSSSSLSDEELLLLLLELSGALVVTDALLCPTLATTAVACPGFPELGSFWALAGAGAGAAAGALGCCLLESTVLSAAGSPAALPAGAVGLGGECRELAALPPTTAAVTYRK